MSVACCNWDGKVTPHDKISYTGYTAYVRTNDLWTYIKENCGYSVSGAKATECILTPLSDRGGEGERVNGMDLVTLFG